jgi:hypothetical protein
MGILLKNLIRRRVRRGHLDGWRYRVTAPLLAVGVR